MKSAYEVMAENFNELLGSAENAVNTLSYSDETNKYFLIDAKLVNHLVEVVNRINSELPD
jgi:hypothetical protein